MRVTGRARHARRLGLLRTLGRLGRGVRRVAAGTGMLALAVPLAWPAGGGGQHLEVPSAASVRSGVVRVADFLAGRHALAPEVPAQAAGSAAGKPHVVPAAVTRAVANATGRSPGKGAGQLPAYQGHRPAAQKFTTPAIPAFNAKTSKPAPSGMTATSDLYKNADGSYTRRVYPAPVNYKTSSGAWAPIDETLVQGSGGRWREKANSAGVSFAAQGDGQPLGTLTAAGGPESVSFSLAGAAHVAGVAAGASLTYPGILSGTDVTETATATGISESLTLRSAAVASSWVFPLKLTGLTASLDGDSVDLSDASGTVRWVIPPAVARSGPVNLAAADSQASSVLKYQLVSYQGGPALQMTLDSSWLDAPGRVFPVTVDPSFSMNPMASDYAQSLNGTAQTADNSGSEFLPSGTVTDSNGTFNDIDFLDFSELGSDLPDQHITAASLNLFDVWAYQCTYTEEVYAYQVTGSWQPSVALTYPGPAYGTKDAQWTGLASTAACSNTSGNPGQGAWISLSLNSSGLSLLNGWTLGTTANYGFAVAPSLTDEEMWKQFDSANDGNVPSGGQCSGNCEPYLQMTYTADTPPQIDSQYPPDNTNPVTLTPELVATGHDPDSWPDPLQYVFTVYDPSGNVVAESPKISAPRWRVTAGKLAWGETYYWTVQDYDGLDYSPTATVSYFSALVPQPLVTTHLSQNTSGAGFGPGSGNYTTSVTDLKEPTAGPSLEVTRDYNSEDPRASGAFGAGWSSVLDMRVSPGEQDASGTTVTQVATYPDGQQVAFGLNADGSYAPPPGRYAQLKAMTSGSIIAEVDTAECVDVNEGSSTPGTKVQMWDCNGNASSQGWTMQSDGTVRINGQCLDITGANYSDGTLIDEWTCNGGANQQWTAVNGELVNPASGMCLDDPGFSTTQGTQLDLWTCNGGSNQRWSVPIGFTLTDKNDTVYRFTQPLGSGAYGITAITDALGRALTFAYNSSGEITTMTAASGRALALAWATPSGAAFPHVSKAWTGPVAGTNTSITQQYTYTGDELDSVCNLSDGATPCRQYSYTAGTDYPESVMDSGPVSYWRLDDAPGTVAANSVLTTEANDQGTYSGVTLGQDAGPLTGSSVTAAGFNGTSSYLQLHPGLASSEDSQTVSLWFKTTTAGGVLFGTSASLITAGTTSGDYSPELYVGSDGKLNAAFWDGNAADVITSPGVVNDGKWHNAVLADSAAGQALYLDGAQDGTLAKGLASDSQLQVYVGAGFIGGGWPDEPHYDPGNDTGYASYFNGDISDVAIWTGKLTGSEATAMYAAGTRQADLLTKVTRPSGKTRATIAYDPGTGRAVTVTDASGGTWHIGGQAVAGSSQVYAASVLGAEPADYWRLNHSGVTDAVNQVNGGTAVFSSVTQGVSGGPFSDATVDSFDGSSSYIALPSGLVSSQWSQSVSLWFKTTGTNEVLFSSSADTIANSTTSGSFSPELYVGTDGQLLGGFWDGNTSDDMSSAVHVNDGKWHNVVLADSSSGQVLYLDGKQVDTEPSGFASASETNVYVGAGFLGGGWLDEPYYGYTAHRVYFTGEIAEVAFYRSELTDAQDTAEYQAAQQSSGLTPVATVTVTDPGGHPLSYSYDMLNGNRMLSQVNAEGGKTTYGYDTSGFQDQVTDPDGNVTDTGHDIRGNIVSRTTCQDLAAVKCSTSYYTYYPDDTTIDPPADPRNDLVLTYADGRSASASDTTYRTTYSYDSAGNLTAVTTPPTAGYPSGRTTTYAYTDGTDSTGGYNGAVPSAGLPYQVTTPGGAVTTTLYYADGDQAQVTSPDGLVTRYSYDGIGRLASKTVTSDTFPNGLTTSYAYDAESRVIKETDPPVTDRVTGAQHTKQVTTGYDPDGDVTSQVTADTTGGDASRTVTNTYDSHDELASVTDPAGAVTAYTYDAYGNKASQTDADGNVTDYAYDGDGHLLTTTLENYTGSPAGSQSAAPLVEESRAYDLAGRLASVTDAMGRVTDYGYTDNGLLATVTLKSADGSQSFTGRSDTYDPAGHLVKQVTDNGQTETDYTVNADDQVTAATMDPSGLDRTTSTSYTPDDQPATVTVSGPSGTAKATSYTYDPAGNVTSRSVTQPGAGGPVASFPLTQSSGTAVADATGNGNDANATGVTWTGDSASFAGASGQQVATRGPVLDTTGSFTVSAWVDLAGNTSDNQTVVSQDAGTDSGFYLKYYPVDGKWEFMRPEADVTGPPTIGVDSQAGAATGTWTFLTGTYDAGSGTITLYMNGASAGTVTDPSPIASDGPLAIGRSKWDGSATDFFDGQIADVQAYQRALTASQVAALYGQGRPGGGTGPAGSWPLTEASGTVATDASGNGNDATAAGVTWTGDSASFAAASGQQVATSGPVLDTTGSYSVSAWADLAGNTSGNQTVVSQAAGTDSGFYLKYYPGNGKWEFNLPASDTTDPPGAGVASADGAVTGTWTFLTGTYDAGSGTITLYVNGVSAGTATNTTPIASDGPLLIGRSKWDGNPVDFFDGQIADVQAYSSALTASQVAALYSQGRSGGAATGELTTTWTRDERGLPTSMTGPDGNVTDYSYDAAGRLAVTTRPPVTTQTYDTSSGSGTTVTARPVTTTGYDTFGDEAETEDPDGNVTVYGYDADSRVVSQTLPSYTPPGSSSAVTAVSTKAYDGLGLLTSASDALGNTANYAYDQLGDRTRVTAPNGAVTSYAYDSDGEQLSATGPTGAVTEATYDFLGRPATVTQVERNNSTGSTQAYTTQDSYGTGGWLAKTVTPQGVATSYAYNPAGEETSVTDGAGNTTSYSYDALGRRTAVTNPDGTATVAAYDASGDVTSVTSLDASTSPLAVTSAGWDGNGDQLSSTGARGNATTFTYDAAGTLTAQSQPATSSAGITVSFGYDAAGNQTRYTDGNGNDWYYTYNSWGLPESRVEPATSQYTSAADTTFTTAYDADGRPATVTEPGGVTVTDTYNSVGELTGQSGAGADAATPDRSLGYDQAGDLTSASTSNTAASGQASNATSESFTYDDRGLVLTASGSAGSTSYAYNGDGQVTSVADAAGTTAYTYDGAGRLATLADPATGTTLSYSYNSDSQVRQIAYGTGNDTRSFTYDSQHRLASDTLATASGTTVASVGYGYNADGQVTSKTTAGLAGPATSTYTYDQAGRLTSWENGTVTTGYAYDGNGNLTQNGSKTYTYDARDELTSDGTNSYAYTARGTRSSETTGSGTVASSFDAYGQQVTGGDGSYTHDALGRMTAAADSQAGTSWQFSYAGPTGTIASDGTSAYTWDPSGAALIGTGAPGGGGGVLDLADIHGDVVGQFTAAGASVAGSQAYGPWGAVTASSGPVAGRLGFQSGWTSPASGQVAMGARWYDPGAGGFTSADTVQVSPVPDAAAGNPFAYVGDNPLTWTDPTGHHCWSGFGLVCAAAHAVASRFDRVRHAAAARMDQLWHGAASLVSGLYQASRALASLAWRGVRNLALKVADEQRAAYDKVVSYAKSAYSYAKSTYHKAVSYAENAYSYAKSTYHKAVSYAKNAYSYAKSAYGLARHAAAKAAAWVPDHVQQAVKATGRFLAKHAAQIGGLVTGVAVFAGCEAATGTVGSIACAAAAGAAANAVSYAITAAQTGSFSASGLSESVLTGAAEGAAGGMFGKVLSAAGSAVTSSLADSMAAEGDAAAADAAAGDPAAEKGGQSSCPISSSFSFGGESFTAGTLVLLASGKAVPVSHLKVGDTVLASDTKTGKDQPEKVTAVLVHHDTNLYNLTVKTARGTEVIHTTSNHLFWDPYQHQWIASNKLAKGEHLKTPSGAVAVADGGTTPKVHDGWMWDLTVPGNNDHDFYVVPAQQGSQHNYHGQAGNTPVLVHNAGGCGPLDNGYKWPRNNGFEGPSVTVNLSKGYQFDRYGGIPATDTGRFASPAGTAFEMRSLPPSSLSRPLTTYEVVRSFDVQTGVVRPWGGQPGGGFQLNFSTSIADLLKQGFIKVVS